MGQLSEPPPEPPRTYVDLGVVLARQRGRRTLRSVASDCGLRSSSSLQRYESGRPMPRDVARALDEYYEMSGWLVDAVSRLEVTAGRWLPRVACTTFVHTWPEEHQGWVWIGLRADPARVGRLHLVRLRWGPWRQDLRIPLKMDGEALTTGKGKDLSGRTVPFHLEVDHAVVATFGVDAPPEDLAARDISLGWEFMEP
ncbi:helix-turn-helix domain-containing protein [Kineosporia sp. R_H_3]|uniref:helix-turn-helix domain-containing protein n=1 Tax=Kineosporia sp. R_H_3 TaxID=1961848 RepID=UPI00350EF256